MQIAEGIARRGIRKRYYLETRGDVLLRNKEVFKLWKRLGLNTMFLGLEAIDEEGLKRYRKRVTLNKNFEALEYARSLDITVAVNIIADPSWDRERFKVVRDWCLEIPEVVNISINTPYPGTETWQMNHGALPRTITDCLTSNTQCCQQSCRCRNFTTSSSKLSACSRANILAGRRCAGAQESWCDTCFAGKQIFCE